LRQAGVLDRVALCVPEAEVDRYKRNGWPGVVGVPPTHPRIAKKREWILTVLAFQRQAKKVLILDDDLRFSYRDHLGEIHLNKATPDSMKMMFEQLDTWMNSGFVHVGISHRSGNNTEPEDYKDATRMTAAYQYDTYMLSKLIEAGKVTLARLEVMEDIDLTLQLLRLGYPNRVTFQYTWDQVSSKSGGCSQWRTPEIQAECAHKLAELHPGFVKVTEKTTNTKDAWKGMKTRTDVVVSWAKAYKSALQEK
jgi:hypothetical protein